MDSSGSSTDSSKERTKMSPDTVTSPTKVLSPGTKAVSSDGSCDETSESFGFAPLNGALGVLEVHGWRIRDFRPKWPASSFVATDGLISAMAYRFPHIVMGDRMANIKWWDMTTGSSSSFSTHRAGIRKIKISPVVAGDCSRRCVAVLFYDNTFLIYDLDSPDPVANSLLQPQFLGTHVLELDWLPLHSNNGDMQLLCISGADGSFHLLEFNINDKRVAHGAMPQAVIERYRPMPLCTPILLPTPHALALCMILQLGVKPSWFNTCSTTIIKRPHLIRGTICSDADLRSYMIDSPSIDDTILPELLLKVLEPYRKEGSLLDDERAKLYASIVNKGSAASFAFAAAFFGESSEAVFWLQLPRALKHLMKRLLGKSSWTVPSSTTPESEDTSIESGIPSKGKSVPGTGKCDASSHGQLRLMAFEQEELWENATERITWHEKLEGEEAIQNRVHELVSVGNLEAAVSLLLLTPPESSYFNANSLRAVALSSAVLRSLLELAVKLQDAGCWIHATTLAAAHLNGSDYARVLRRWANHVLQAEHNIWRAVILYVAAGALQDALAALREAQQPDAAAMFIVVCNEIYPEIISSLSNSNDEGISAVMNKKVELPGLDPENQDVIVVNEYYSQYQTKLVHLSMDVQSSYD